MSNVYVIDTGEREFYVVANNECDATEAAVAMGEGFNYCEWYSDDPSDIGTDQDVIYVQSTSTGYGGDGAAVREVEQ